MATITLVVPESVTLNRDGRIQQPGDSFTTDKDDEVAQWLNHGYAEEVKAKKQKQKKSSKKKS